MSKIGSNIRKIRTVKGLSQSQFAELFELNRARIGAYEEGRAEPKIDVVIQIAKYFSIPLNDIFVKDLTVNQLTHFDLVQNPVQSNSKTDSESSIQQLYFLGAAQLLNQNLLSQAMKNPEELYRFPFPGNSYRGNMWVDLAGIKLKKGSNVHATALIVSSEDNAKAQDLVLAITNDSIYLGKYISGKTKLKIQIGENEEEVNPVNHFFPVRLVIQKSIASGSSIELRIDELEERIARLEKIK